MKTLGEIENEVKIVSNAFVIVALSKRRDQADALVTANGKQSDLFASLAAWDAVLQECYPCLKDEHDALNRLKEASTFEDQSSAISSVRWSRYDDVIEPNDELEIIIGYRINNAGLARLEYLRGILGEEAP